MNFDDHRIRSRNLLSHDGTDRSSMSPSQFPVRNTMIHVENCIGVQNKRHLRILRMAMTNRLNRNRVRFVRANERIDDLRFRMESTQSNQLGSRIRSRGSLSGNRPDDHTMTKTRPKFLEQLIRRTLLRPESQQRRKTVSFSFYFPSKDTKRRSTTTKVEKCSTEQTQRLVQIERSSSRARGRMPIYRKQITTDEVILMTLIVEMTTQDFQTATFL